MSNLISRRDILKQSTMIAVGLVAPSWLSSVARADLLRQSKGGKPNSNTVFVVIQLSGGNDGLNTVIPFTNKKYYELRPTLGIKEDIALKLNDSMGLHPALKSLHGLYKKGKVAVIQGVGYPKANRSHFKSMDIWHSASPELTYNNGWIGRHVDAIASQGSANPVVALGLSGDRPRALAGEKFNIPCFASLADIQAMVGNADAEKMLRQIQGAASSDPNARLVQQASMSALDSMSALRDKLATFTPKQQYPNGKFGEGLKQIAQLVATSPQTRVVYFSTGGFDTHARQAESHEKLLQDFGDAIAAFQAEMEAVGKADNVVVMVFSEFGRRSYENASGGTDHGAAGPMFLIGNKVKGGLHGPIPDLNNLEDGDVKFSIDFRQVYATALDNWMGGNSGSVLGSEFKHLDIL